MKPIDKIKKVTLQLCPPILLPVLKALYVWFKKSQARNRSVSPIHQDIDIYWNPKMAAILETWGEGNVWNEIKFLMVNCDGNVLDVGCGTGKTMEIISKNFPVIDVYGCDISGFLIKKALDRNLPQDHLIVCDATQLNYPDNFFNYGYSIGTLEHFTEDGIMKVLQESYRVVRKACFHQHPVSRSGKNEGWITLYQSYYNNSVQWWMEKYKAIYQTVYIIDSAWEDENSVGKWFVCVK